MVVRHIDEVLAQLNREDFAGLRALLASYEAAGWISGSEANQWRHRIQCWEAFLALESGIRPS